MKFERKKKKRAFFGPPSPLSLPFLSLATAPFFLLPSPGLLCFSWSLYGREGGWNILSPVFDLFIFVPFLLFEQFPLVRCCVGFGSSVYCS
jgi:hypothetical protein